ncbi:MAG: PAS domain S-box protein [Pseudomonadota bacterium]
MKIKDILLVDDDRVAAAFVEDILVKEGYSVQYVRDGKEALDAIRESAPDAIFTDLIMPKISGEELIRHVREMPGMGDIVIVVVTGTISEQHEVLRTLPVNAFIPKGPPDLLRADVLSVCRHLKKFPTLSMPLTTETALRLAPRRVVKELLASRQYREKIIERLSEGLVILDTDFRVIKINAMAERFLNKPVVDFIGRSFSECFENRDKDAIEDLLTTLLAGEDTESQKIIVRHLERILNLKFSILVDQVSHNVVACLALIEDITERKLLERTLHESEERYRAIVNTVPDVIYHLDSEGRFLFVNFSVEKLGYTSGELIGKSFLEIVHPDDVEQAKYTFNERRVSGRGPEGVELRLVPKEAKETRIYNVRNMSVIIKARGLYDVPDHDIHNGGKRFIGTQGIAHDITDRKMMEGILVKAKEDWELTFDAITDLVMLLDKDHCIVRINKAAADALGVDKEEILGRKCYEVVHNHGQPIAGCPLQRTTRDQLPHSREIEESNLDGVFICSTAPIQDKKGEILGYTHSLKDITERKRLEAQFHEAQKMEAIGTLAGGIAHDFNNLLMGIQGYASLMLLKIDSVHPHFEKLKKIEDQIKSASELTNQLLGFARGGKYQVRPIDLNKLVTKSVEMFRKTKKEIVAHTKVSEELIIIEGDQYQVEQVLLNLYVNAWQAMPEGGDLSVELGPVIVEATDAEFYEIQPGRYVRISVRDTGIGMDQETRARIFEPFFTTKEMGRGTGLGLASVYGIVRNHNGAIEVESEVGKGSTFHIYFPISEKALEEEKSPTDEIIKGKGTILLVDDEEIILDVGSELLTSLGYTVIRASSGKEAVDIYRDKNDEIDLVILDIVMPVMGGGETYDMLKGIKSDIKVILSSGYSIDKKSDDIIAGGVNDFLQKPFNVEVLSQKVKEVLVIS